MSCTNVCKAPVTMQAHCSLCHVTFKSVSGFDKHRVGGICALPQDVGMSVQGGVWYVPMTTQARARFTGQI